MTPQEQATPRPDDCVETTGKVIDLMDALKQGLAKSAAEIRAENERLRADVARLREALEEFVRVMADPRTTASMPHTVAKARAALLATQREG